VGTVVLKTPRVIGPLQGAFFATCAVFSDVRKIDSKEKKEVAVVHHAVVEGEHAHVSAVVDVVAPYDGVAMVLHPDAHQGVVADLVVLVDALRGGGQRLTLAEKGDRQGSHDSMLGSYLRVVRDVQPHVLTVADVAVLDGGTGALTAHAHRRTHCNIL